MLADVAIKRVATPYERLVAGSVHLCRADGIRIVPAAVKEQAISECRPPAVATINLLDRTEVGKADRIRNVPAAVQEQAISECRLPAWGLRLNDHGQKN